MFTLLAFRYRKEFFWSRVSWPILAFATSQIILATMFLRWHYLVDITAGLALAFLAVTAADRSVRWDDARRERLGLAPAWRRLDWARLLRGRG
jgi:membrane-associated phospholipid phosphatase